MRDCIKQAEIGRKAISSNMDMTAGEMRQLHDIFIKASTPSEGLWDIISTAFYMGYAVGERGAAKKGKA